MDNTKKIPVILDTDIGSDIDDTYALAFLLRSPELDVKLITTCTGDTEHRAALTAKFLEVAKRTDIPVGIGPKFNDGTYENQKMWVEGYNLSRYPGKVLKDGAGALIDAIMKSPEPVTLISIGPSPTISSALEREPGIALKARFVGMHGSIRMGYFGSEKINAEYNVVKYLKECRRIFDSPWISMTITPLDTCGLVQIKGEKYQKLLKSADTLAKACNENYRIWLDTYKPALNYETETSVMYDAVAIYLAFSRELLTIENLGIRITDEGFMVIDEKAKRIDCATYWKDLPAFEDLLVNRITGN